MMSQHKFTDFNKCPTLMEYIDGIGGYACLRLGEYGNSLHFLLNFAMDLKLL